MAGYGSAANPISRDPWEYIVGVHWGKNPITPVSGASPYADAVGIVQGVFSDFEADLGGQWTLISEYYQFSSRFVQLPIVFYVGNSSYTVPSGSSCEFDLYCTYVSAAPPLATPCQCAILDGHTLAPLAVSPVTLGPNFCSLQVSAASYVVPAFRVVGAGPPAMAALLASWDASWWS